jgi:predicted RNA-binding protein with PIN domain
LTLERFSLFQGNITKHFSVYYKYNSDDVILVFDATGKPTPSKKAIKKKLKKLKASSDIDQNTKTIGWFS